MCSPVGHVLASLIIGRRFAQVNPSGQSKLGKGYFLFCMVSAVAADFDFFVGWALGDINGYHHLGSHSVFFAMGYGILIFIVVALLGLNAHEKYRWTVSGTLIYLSHSILDFYSQDDSEPRGLQLFWPISDQFYYAQNPVFPKFLHDTTGGDMWGMVVGLFNWHNLITVIFETVAFTIIFLLVVGSGRLFRSVNK